MAWFPGRRRSGEKDDVVGSHRSFATTAASASDTPERQPSVAREAALAQVDAYERQRALLERELGADPESPWVSKIGALQRADGTVFTMTTWGQNVTTLLPVADVISLSEIGLETVRVGRYVWDDVARLVADDCWRIRDDLRPPRVLAYAWPSSEVYEQLRLHAIDEDVFPNPQFDPTSDIASRIHDRATENRQQPD